MERSIANGCVSKEEYIPGPLKVKRRAPKLYSKLIKECNFTPSNIETTIKSDTQNNQIMLKVNSPDNVRANTTDVSSNTVGSGKKKLFAIDFLSVFAIAVNEENAAGGRVVTAPTNGAAGSKR